MSNNNEAYRSHKWTSKRRGGRPDDLDANEVVIYCVECGIENVGDPAEIPDLRYPMCFEEAA